MLRMFRMHPRIEIRLSAPPALQRPPEPLDAASPCVNICRIGAQGYCEGCLRTLDEIARWTSMGEAERDRVMRELPARGAR